MHLDPDHLATLAAILVSAHWLWGAPGAEAAVYRDNRHVATLALDQDQEITVAGRLGPVRIFRVTGTFTAFTTAAIILATSFSSAISADPAMTRQTFFAGQPMFMSIMSAPLSTL